MQLVIPQAVYGVMLAHVQAQWPEEACGMLAGGPAEVVRRVYLIENTRHSSTEYEMHATEQVQAMLEMEAQDMDLLGIFHSHPHGPPTPSATDVALAYYPEAVYVICSPDAHGAWQVAGFRIEKGVVDSVRVQVI